MAGKQKTFKIQEQSWFRTVLLVVGSVLSALVLTFSVLTILSIVKGDITTAPNYLLWVFFFLAGTRFITFLKNPTKVSLIRTIVLVVLNVALGILVIFAKYDMYIFSISAGIYCITMIISRVFKLIERHRVRDIVFNAILIVLVGLLTLAMFLRVDENYLIAIVAVECFLIAGSALFEIGAVAFAQLRLKVLFKIIVKTYALEILFGLLTLMIASSLVLMMFEDSMPSFWDALWYTFAVVTTIGFGDFTCVTAVGRIITVILGMYGIVVVAVITSIIVNFYNETSGSKDSKEIKEIKKDEENK